MPMQKLTNFLELNSLELVSQLSASVRPLLCHLFRICRRPNVANQFSEAGSERDLAICLLDLLKEGDQHILMAFLCALLHCGHLRLFCRFSGLHLVDTRRFEQFARTNDELAFPVEGQMPNFEGLSPSDLAHRLAFVQHHAEMLRLTLVEVPRMEAILAKWGVLGNEAEGEEGEGGENGNGTAEEGTGCGLVDDWKEEASGKGCESLIGLLLDQKQPVHALECFCLCLLATRQFRNFSIFHGLADLVWMDRCWGNFVGNGGRWGAEENGNCGGGGEEGEEAMPRLRGVLEDLRVEAVDSAGSGTFDLLGYYKEHRSEIYANFSSPKGLGLIINNYCFQNRTQREGSQVDVINISKLLKQLSYKVFEKEDLTADQIKSAMYCFAARPEHQQLDSAIVVLMSHGEYEGIMGTDDRLVNVHELVRVLNQNALGLRGKPKIFIVQACRGDGRDAGISRELQAHEGADSSSSTDGPSSLWSSLFSSARPKKSPLNKTSVFRNNPVPASPNASFRLGPRPSLQSVTEPTEADVLIAYPTTPHYVSWRNSASGSWFVQTLCEVFSRRAKEEDIMAMLARVNGEVAKREASCEQKWKQAPEQCTRLRKRFFFFPGVNYTQLG